MDFLFRTFETSRRELSFWFDKSGSARFRLFPLSFCERRGGWNDRGLDKKAKCKLLFFFRSASVDSSGIAKPTNQFAWSWGLHWRIANVRLPVAERVARERVEQHRKERLLVSRSWRERNVNRTVSGFSPLLLFAFPASRIKRPKTSEFPQLFQPFPPNFSGVYVYFFFLPLAFKIIA